MSHIRYVANASKTENLTSNSSVNKGGIAIPHHKDLEDRRKDLDAYYAHQEALRTKKLAEDLRLEAEKAQKTAQELEIQAREAEERAKAAAERSSEAQKHSKINYEEEERIREEKRKNSSNSQNRVISLPRLSEKPVEKPVKKKILSRFFSWIFGQS